MRLYWEVARRAYQRQVTYRTENLAGSGDVYVGGNLPDIETIVRHIFTSRVSTHVRCRWVEREKAAFELMTSYPGIGPRCASAARRATADAQVSTSYLARSSSSTGSVCRARAAAGQRPGGHAARAAARHTRSAGGRGRRCAGAARRAAARRRGRGARDGVAVGAGAPRGLPRGADRRADGPRGDAGSAGAGRLARDCPRPAGVPGPAARVRRPGCCAGPSSSPCACCPSRCCRCCRRSHRASSSRRSAVGSSPRLCS